MTSVFDNAYTAFKDAIKDIEVGPRTLALLMKYGMEVVEMTEVKGPAQRALVVRLVRQAVVDAPFADEKEALCLSLIDNGVLDTAIDVVVDASRGKVGINQAIEVAGVCCTLF